MKKINIPLASDTLFTALCSFLLFFTALRFYTKNAVIGLVFGIAAALVFGAIAFLYISRKQSKSLLITAEQREKKLLALHLSLSSDDSVLKLFSKCIEGSKKYGKRLIVGEQLIFFKFKMQPLSEDDIAPVIKYNRDRHKIVYCNSISPEAMGLADYFGIEIKTSEDIYSLLKGADLLPEKYAYEGKPAPGFFKRIKLRFTRKLCAPLFFSGVALVAISYFTFFPVYYIISGGIMLILSVIALLLGR